MKRKKQKKLSAALLFLLLTIDVSFCQVSGPLPVLTAGDLPEADITGTREYSDESLYGYIDGGAELYIEYGFDTLFITDIVFNGAEIKAEVYRMKDTEAAFGIFSVSRFKCSGESDMTEHYCQTQYQLQFCKGCYYVSIVNNTATKAEQNLSVHIASILLDRIKDESFNASSFFTDEPTPELMKTAVLVRGRLGLFNGAYGLSENLEECNGYTALIIKPAGRNIVSIRFDSETSMRQFLDKEKADFEKLKTGNQISTDTGNTLRMTASHKIIMELADSF